MIVKHIGANGKVRRTFENVSSIHLYTWNTEYPLSLINLAPGESVEREEDEPARS